MKFSREMKSSSLQKRNRVGGGGGLSTGVKKNDEVSHELEPAGRVFQHETSRPRPIARFIFGGSKGRKRKIGIERRRRRRRKKAVRIVFHRVRGRSKDAELDTSLHRHCERVAPKNQK